MSYDPLATPPPATRPATPAADDRLRTGRWFGRVTEIARSLSLSRTTVASTRPPDVQPEHVMVIVALASRHISATVAAVHPAHGDKVVAHKHIECDWHRLSAHGQREALADVVRLVCDSAGVEAYSVYIALSDASIASRVAVGWADPGEEVTLSEYERLWALKRARDQATSAGEELLDAVPMLWSVRSRAGERDVEDPLGERGNRLTCHALLITARAGYRDDLAELVQDIGLELEGIIPQPLAVYRGLSSSITRKGPAIIIDCGARHTSLLVRRRDRLVHVETFAFGGDDLTQLLSERLEISLTQAEELKRNLDVSLRDAEREHHGGQQFIWNDVRERHRLLGPALQLVAQQLDAFFRARIQELRDHGHLTQNSQIHLVGRASALGGLPLFLKELAEVPVVLGSGHKNRDPGTEMADVSISGLVCLAADQRRAHLAQENKRISKTASGMWSWLTHKAPS